MRPDLRLQRKYLHLPLFLLIVIDPPDQPSDFVQHMVDGKGDFAYFPMLYVDRHVKVAFGNQLHFAVQDGQRFCNAGCDVNGSENGQTQQRQQGYKYRPDNGVHELEQFVLRNDRNRFPVRQARSGSNEVAVRGRPRRLLFPDYVDAVLSQHLCRRLAYFTAVVAVDYIFCSHLSGKTSYSP